MKGRFDQSRRLVWTMLYASIGLQLLALIVAKEAAVPVLTASIPSMLALAGAWSGITNWAEVRRPKLEE